MKNFTLNKLWALRAELDEAIITKDYDRIKAVKIKYENLAEKGWRFKRAFICYNHGFWNEGQRDSHVFANVNSILENIQNYERKYLDGEDVSVKLKTKSQSVTPFLAEEIWVLRAMYDKFLLQGRKSQEELQMQQNMILGKAVKDRLQTLVGMEQTEGYHEEILSMLTEVRAGYESVYGKNQPRISYPQIAEEFLER